MRRRLALIACAACDPSRTKPARFCCDARSWPATPVRNPWIGGWPNEPARVHHMLGGAIANTTSQVAKLR